jgi:ribulose-bisphosphate carboxylase large chain
MAYNLDIFRNEKDLARYFYVTYEIESSVNLRDAAWNIATGQSIGNPNMRSIWETNEMIELFCCKIIVNKNFQKKKGLITIGFPNANIDWDTDGIAQLLCMIQGGHVDIDTIKKCRVIDIEIHPHIINTHFKRPTYGITGIREFTGVYNKPFFGSIVKPKTGLKPNELLDLVKALCDGGVNFIKEDEILSNPDICRLENRVELISNYIAGKRIIYSFCINADPAIIENRARFVSQNGGNGVHLNIWSGLGSYRTIRNLNIGLFIHYQKSGDQVITGKRNPYGIEWTVLCKLAAMSGVDTIHAGMWGGYHSDPEDEITAYMDVLHRGNVLPALSCGMTAELIAPIVEKFGVDWMANVGGAIHSDPKGTIAGALKIRKAIDNLGGY